MTSTTVQSAEILELWFGTPSDPEWGRNRKLWWEKNHEFDALIRDRYLPAHEAAAAGVLDAWRETAEGSLALLILLDQFPRNMFRDGPRTYATDAMALDVARATLDRGFEDELTEIQRWFLYMPFQHSERLEDQERSLELYARLSDAEDNEGSKKSSHRHHEIVARFGRFPHRNAALGRTSTEEELAFLQEPDSSF